MSDCTVALVGHNDLRRLCAQSSQVTAALWRSTLIDTAIFKEWVLNMGARAAPVRIAHLFCEFIVRLDAVGLVTDGVCDFPLTQSELGDATGISTVHVNRSLMELRASGLIDLKSGRLKVSNMDALMRAGDFDPSYLHAGD